MLLLLLPTRSRITHKKILTLIPLYSSIKINVKIFIYVIRDLVSNNNSVANIFYLTKKSNQPEDGS